MSIHFIDPPQRYLPGTPNAGPLYEGMNLANGLPCCFKCARGRGWWTDGGGYRHALCLRSWDARPHMHVCDRHWLEADDRDRLLIGENPKTIEYERTYANPLGVGEPLAQLFRELRREDIGSALPYCPRA